MKNTTLIFVMLFASIYEMSAQRILAYFPYYRSTADADNVDWPKLTDIVYAFVNPSISTGALDQPEYNTSLFDYVADKAKANGVKVSVSVGGGGLSWKLSQTIDNATSRTNLINNIVAFVSGTNSGNHILAGVDVDWEFPTTTTEKNKHENFLKDLRTALNTKGTQDSRYYELSIAVGGDVVSSTNHTSYINAGAVQYCDFISLMVYDGPLSYGNNHAPYQMAVDAINAYSSAPLNFPKSKFMLAVPFYGATASRSNADLYKSIAASNPSGAYAADTYNSWYYNGNQTLRNKVDLICSEGGMGITIWEITQDRNSGQTYTLLSAVAAQMSIGSCGPNGVKEHNSIAGFNIYPNPSLGLLYIEGNDISKIEVFNMLGQNVSSFSGSWQSNQSLDVSMLNSGMYMVNIQDSFGNSVASLVVKN